MPVTLYDEAKCKIVLERCPRERRSGCGDQFTRLFHGLFLRLGHSCGRDILGRTGRALPNSNLKS
nr:hypothetical protein Iba_chr12aCG6360 [Ipomoea batatas]GMD72275.1 hypothetical protein Iba_chr12fCG7030 [Ipomoea batatas]